MIQVTQSPFLQALGYSIINSLWQFAFLWLLYFIINIIFKLSAHQKYTAGLLLQITGFIWFAGTLAFYYHHCSTIAATLNQYNYSFNLLEASATSVKDKLFIWIIKTEQVLPYLSIAYLLLLLFLSIKWLQSYFYTHRIKRSGLSKIDVDWRLFVQRLSAQLGIRRPVKICLSNIVKSPLTIGFLKPIILIPLASINHLTTEQTEAVILHELAHIKRADYLLNLILSVIEATLFFNPFMQLLSKHIKKERENSCDDWVLQYEYNAAAYARALLQIAMFQSSQPSFAMNVAKDNNVLLTRVKRIIEKSERSFYYRHQLIALLFITTLLSSIAWLSPANKMGVLNNNKVKKVIAEPMAAKIENPLFNPVFFLANDDVEKIRLEMEKEVKQVERHSQKIMRPKRIPLAIPIKTRNLDLEEIPAPVIVNPALVAKTKVHLSPRLIFNIDTLLIKKLFSNRLLAEIEKTENDVKKSLTLAMGKNIQAKQLYDKEKVIKNMKAALAQIKATKLKVLRNQPTVTTKVYTRANNLLYQQALSSELKRYEQEDDMQALAEEITKVLEEVQQQYITVSKWDKNINSNFEIPAVLYSVPRAHSYSFEFSEKPKIRVWTETALETSNTDNKFRTLTKPCQNIVPKKEIETLHHPSTPCNEQPAKKVISKTNKLPIVHI